MHQKRARFLRREVLRYGTVHVGMLQLILDWRSYTAVDWILLGCVVVALISFIGGLIAFYVTNH